MPVQNTMPHTVEAEQICVPAEIENFPDDKSGYIQRADQNQPACRAVVETGISRLDIHMSGRNRGG